MSTNKVWMITGAGRGMGLDFAKAALAAGYSVVATGRDKEKVESAFGEAENLLVVKLDVTNPSDAEAAVKAAVDKFGRIDVLVNNAGSFFGGFFEELTPDQIQTQLNVNLIGPMNVTRAVLPVMRKQRSGRVISVSSAAGFIGYEYGSAYNVSKFAIEGWMEALHLDVAPFNIKTTILAPGFFRTELLTENSIFLAEPSIDDYAEGNAQFRPFWSQMNGNQSGDPAKLAKALIAIANLEEPPARWIAGADALAEAERKAKEFQQQMDTYRDLSTSLAFEDAQTNA